MEKEIEAIKERNKKVETDKAWETSWTRRLFIAAATYLIAVLWLAIINESAPWLKSAVPAGGYLLSTLSLNFIKKWWMGKKMADEMMTQLPRWRKDPRSSTDDGASKK